MIVLLTGNDNNRETISCVSKVKIRHTEGGRTLVNFTDTLGRESGEVDLNITRVELLPEVVKL